MASYEKIQAAAKTAKREDTNASYTCDVLIVGSGPVGATFARKLVDKNLKVLMIEIGDQATRRVGDHRKNSVAAQKDISLFTNIVKGELHPLSVPTPDAALYVEPVSWDPDPAQISCLQNGQNPDQKSWDNLPSAAATRVVGGMGAHWTCCTPRPHDSEKSDLFTEEEWNKLYGEAETLFDTNDTSFDKSIRQQLVKHVLADAYKKEHREIKSMPLACKRSENNKNYVEWSCSATILGDLADPKYSGPNFEIQPNTQCMRLLRDVNAEPAKIIGAVVKDLLKGGERFITAKKYVLCAGAVLTPGIMAASGFTKEDLPALGHYMTEQSMAFCQIILKRSLVDNVINDPYHLGWTEIVKKHQKHHPKDPLPFPFKDPDPQCYFPFSNTNPWHTQIHRDAFGYGEVPATVDQRLIVDFRWFTYAEPQYNNFVEFLGKITDEFGMPQPTFHFRPSDDDANRCERMITDMVEVARNLGGFLPGAEPKYLAPGSALHICGTYRAGKSDKDSVVDRTGKVWNCSNLVLGGCGVIPQGLACNPTLTAACFAIAAANKIAAEIGGQ